MAHEAQLWATCRKHLSPHGDFERIENMVGVGRPDVNYCLRGTEGNIELKHVAVWPKGLNTVISIPHYTGVQRTWAKRRLAAGGRVYVLLQVADTYMLLPGAWAREHLGIDAKGLDLRAAALVWSAGRFPTEDLLRVLGS